MDIFNILVVQPIFNALLLIYAFIGDFGLSIILFTILVRLALWPLIKKQLHQTKLMRKVQPDLKKIKARTKGNKQLEAQLMMELYREKGIKPFSSIGVLIIQLPIFIGIYVVINIITTQRDQIASRLYGFTKEIPAVNEIISSKEFNESLLGLIDLTQTALGGGSLHIPLVILAIIAALFQYIQTKQLMPSDESQKKLRDILKDTSRGKEADQSEISAAMGSKIATVMPIILLVVALYMPGAVVLYYAASSIVAVIQQHFVLRKDEEEMVTLASQKDPRKIKEAEVVSRKTIPNKKNKKKRKKR